MLFGEFDDGAPQLVTGGSDHMIRFWVAGNHDGTLTEVGPAIKFGSAPVNALAMLPTGHGPILAAGGGDGSVHLLDIADRSVLAVLHVGEDAEPVTALAGVPAADGRWLLLGIGRYGTLRLWRPDDTRQQVHRLPPEGPIEASHAFGSNLAIATRRGLSLLTLTFSDPPEFSSGADGAQSASVSVNLSRQTPECLRDQQNGRQP
jgi:WD40 repeat protein